jgi:hypothetical protein
MSTSLDPANPNEKNRRSTSRKRPRKHTGIECRKGTLGLGPNLALELAQLSEQGAQVRIHSGLKVGDEVELVFLGENGGRGVKVVGKVVWIKPTNTSKEAILGVRFHKRLSYRDYIQFV